MNEYEYYKVSEISGLQILVFFFYIQIKCLKASKPTSVVRIPDYVIFWRLYDAKFIEGSKVL